MKVADNLTGEDDSLKYPQAESLALPADQEFMGITGRSESENPHHQAANTLFD